MDDELRVLHQRLEVLEREHAEQIARANRALAAAQDKSYWLDRWGLDLNAVMRRRGAAELLTVVRAVRLLLRTGAQAAARLAAVPSRVQSARHKARGETGRARDRS